MGSRDQENAGRTKLGVPGGRGVSLQLLTIDRQTDDPPSGRVTRQHSPTDAAIYYLKDGALDGPQIHLPPSPKWFRRRKQRFNQRPAPSSDGSDGKLIHYTTILDAF